SWLVRFTSTRASPLLSAAALAARAGCARRSDRRRRPGAGVDQRDVQVLERRFLEPFQLDEGLSIIENRSQLRVPGIGEIPLRLDDEVVRRHADLELALLGFEFFLSQLARRLRGFDGFRGVLSLNRR